MQPSILEKNTQQGNTPRDIKYILAVNRVNQPVRLTVRVRLQKYHTRTLTVFFGCAYNSVKTINYVLHCIQLNNK